MARMRAVRHHSSGTPDVLDLDDLPDLEDRRALGEVVLVTEPGGEHR